jgi:hypothetical protein
MTLGTAMPAPADVGLNLDDKFQCMCCTINRTSRNKTRRKIQLKFHNVMAFPILTYGCENLPLNRVDRRETETAQTKCL